MNFTTKTAKRTIIPAKRCTEIAMPNSTGVLVPRNANEESGKRLLGAVSPLEMKPPDNPSPATADPCTVGPMKQRQKNALDATPINP
jgi:hypothetical protein